MKILIVAATETEIGPTLTHLQEQHRRIGPKSFRLGSGLVDVLITGVGMVPTTFHLAKRLQRNHYDLVLNAGIAGSFRRDWPLGEVVEVVEERFADWGAEAADGSLLDVFSLGLIDPDRPPFRGGRLPNHHPRLRPQLPAAKGLTVQKVHGSHASILVALDRYEAEVESMEGAAVFLTCLLEGVPFAQLRALSNFVEPRQRDNWQIGPAVEALNRELVGLLGDWVIG